MTPDRAILVGLVNRYLGGLMDPFVTLLEIHKLMYFMQEAGERLNLRYVAAPYGPYAENLRHVLAQVEGHFLIGYADGGDQPSRQLKLVPSAVQDALKTLEQTELQESRTRFERVASLVAGFETPFGLELLSTVHWVLTRNRPSSPEDLVRAFYEWSPGKRQFSERQIQLAANLLREGGWVEGQAAA